MPSGNAVWGIDIGQCALKALKLRAAEDGRVEAVAFDVIEHPKILSQPDADRDELISSALEKFASRNEWSGDQFVVGVPGQQTFARFCKMPPIDLKKDAKKIPELVRYEASQQIPFDIDDVVWDYQIFTSADSPDIEVGIFAIRKDLIRKHLGYFSDVRIAPIGVQTIPAALYNFYQFDGEAPGPGAATVLIDVGAQNTDLIIVEENAAWTRNIPLGGNSFTEALVRAFKLSFAKAESLKRSAATSKYARQIFQAMRPVFADLVAEIQRSIGFYSSTHRDVELKKVLALGNAFQLPGLQKYLENNLTIQGGVTRFEKFSKLVPNATVNAPQFTENILSFAAAYGLALQGMGLGRISATLLPTELARVAAWKKKKWYFVATAASLAIAAIIPAGANSLDRAELRSEDAKRGQARNIVANARRLSSQYASAQTNTTNQEEACKQLVKLQKDKRIVPRVVALVNESLPQVYPPALETVTSAEELKALIEENPAEFERTKRNQLIIESLDVEYVTDLDNADVRSGEIRQVEGPAAAGAPSGLGSPPSGAGGRVAPAMGRGAPPRGVSPYAMGNPYARPIGNSMQAGGTGGTPAAAAGEGGFVVRISGRLLAGTRSSQAVNWLTDYASRLRENSQQPGLGFYIPDDDPKGEKKAIGDPAINKYYPTVRPGSAWGDTDQSTAVLDPVTGEDMAHDWQVELAFKLKLGEPPEKEQQPAGGTTPGLAPGQPGPGR